MILKNPVTCSVYGVPPEGMSRETLQEKICTAGLGANGGTVKCIHEPEGIDPSYMNSDDRLFPRSRKGYSQARCVRISIETVQEQRGKFYRDITNEHIVRVCQQIQQAGVRILGCTFGQMVDPCALDLHILGEVEFCEHYPDLPEITAVLTHAMNETILQVGASLPWKDAEEAHSCFAYIRANIKTYPYISALNLRYNHIAAEAKNTIPTTIQKTLQKIRSTGISITTDPNNVLAELAPGFYIRG